MSDERHLRAADVESALQYIFNGNRRFCKLSVTYSLDPGTNNGETVVSMLDPPGSKLAGPILVSVGVKDFDAHTDVDGYVPDEDAVWVLSDCAVIPLALAMGI